MSTAPGLSVIIPVYKVEQYLDQCVASVLRQTFADLEIILVNDGSPDACPTLCDAYAQKDARVRVVHQENLGLAGARNTGLRLATGDYVAFLDSDDYLEPDAYAKLHAAAVSHDADIAFCQARYFDESAESLVEKDDASSLPLFTEERFSGAFSWRDIGAENIFSYDSFVVAWNKICKRSFLSALGADFPLGLIYEDNPFYFQTIFAAKKLCLVRERLITYRINRKGSIIQDVEEGKDYRAMHILAILADTEQRLLSLGKAQDVFSALYRYALSEISYKYQLIPEYLRPKYLSLARGLLPPDIYGKLRLRLWARELKRFRLLPLLSRHRGENTRKLMLFGRFPLLAKEWFSSAPGNYTCIVSMGLEQAPVTSSTMQKEHVFFHCRKFSLGLLLNDLAAFIARPCSGPRRSYIRPKTADASLVQERENVKGLFAISDSILFLDCISSSDPAELRVLYYTMNCIFFDKTIHFLATSPVASCPHPRAVKGFTLTPKEKATGYDSMLQCGKLEQFNHYLALKLLGVSFLVGRKK